ncbi:MAG: ABC transporter ATP-binding protein [Litorilinea sp.]
MNPMPPESANPHTPPAGHASPAPRLVVENVQKHFGGGANARAVLQPISFTLAAGELVCLLGPSGSGKSTLLRIIGGLLAADDAPQHTPNPASAARGAGRVLLNGRTVTAPHPEIGFVFQRTNLMPWRTVIQNVLLPADVKSGRADATQRARAQSLLDLVGLHSFEAAYPRQLSGGMAQRVALARALFQDPDLMLLDEPFGALDALTRERLNMELARIHETQGKTMLMVTHSIQEAVLLADRVLIMGECPGRLVAEVAIDLPRPRRLDQIGEPAFGALSMAVRRAVEDSAEG